MKPRIHQTFRQSTETKHQQQKRHGINIFVSFPNWNNNIRHHQSQQAQQFCHHLHSNNTEQKNSSSSTCTTTLPSP
jgi:hypothetical protein